MKYFKMTNRFDPDDQFYSSSDSDLVSAETTKHILCLDDYEVEEVTEEEFNHETADPKAEALELLDKLKDDIALRYEEETFFDPEAQQNFMDGLMTQLFEITRKVEAI